MLLRNSTTHSILRSILVGKPTACELARTSLPIARSSILSGKLETRRASTVKLGFIPSDHRVSISTESSSLILHITGVISDYQRVSRLLSGEERASIGPRRTCKLCVTKL
ncbi:unnamed protein product [Lasius platythorax]|uniref:Uncharacterized protein n=1 Tax=Lasius platythorax TaxID=488582 RepID=A0AAV2N3A0_9HYME